MSKEEKEHKLKETTLFGIKIGRIEELKDLFKKYGYDLRHDEDFRELKRDFFGEIG